MADLKTKIVIDAEDKASGAVGKVADEVKQLDQAAAKAAPAVDRLGDELDDVSSGAAPALEQTAEAMADTAREADKAADAVGRVGGMEPQIKKLAGAMAGLFAAGKLAGYARDAIATADAYNLLEARMRLAVGPAGDLGAAMERVTQTSNESGAALSSSAELYGRIAQSTTDLGYSQELVADLTDTITKSFVVSGTSAQATSGALTQLAQAFAAGALRGDEFNSVNEAAPELMAALARGLGVARGELRAMAEDGELTTERVLAALESQRSGILASFESLPKTVGGAMQELANNWQIFLGELNNSTGATEKLAGMISTLANNLDTVASLATLAGEALLGLAAARALTAIHGVTAALGAAAGNAGLLATAANTAAAALARLAPMLKVAGASVAAFEVAKAWWDIGDAILRTRELAEEYEQSQQRVAASQDALGARLHAVSQSTGVAVTSMADLNAAIAAGKIHFDELTASWQAGVAPLTETEAAMQRLGPRVFELVGQFDALREAGKSVGESLAGVFDGLDVSGIASLHMAIQAFDELRATGKASAAEVGEAWGAALEQISGQQLAQMTESLRLAGAESEQLAQINDAVLAESYRRLGITAEAAMGGISKGAANAIGALDAIAGSSAATEVGLIAAAQAAYRMADSADAIRAVDERVKAMGESSRVSRTALDGLAEASQKANDALGEMGSKPAAGLQKLGLTADEARQQIATLQAEYERLMSAGDTQGAAGVQAASDVTDAMTRMSITSQKELDTLARVAEQDFNAIRSSGTSTLREQQQAFEKYAEAAIKANNGIASATLKAQAAQLGMGEQLKEMERSAQAATPGIKSLEAHWEKLGQTSSKALREQAAESEKSIDALRRAGATAGELKGAVSDWANTLTQASIQQTGAVDDTTRAMIRQKAESAGLTAEISEDGQVIVKTQKEVQTETEGAAEATEEFGRQVNDTGSVAQWFAGVINMLKGEIEKYSASALDAVNAAWEQGSSLTGVANSISGLAKKAEDFIRADYSRSGLGDELARVKEEAAVARAQVEQLEYSAHFAGAHAGMWQYIQALNEMNAALAEARAKQIEFEITVEQFNRRVDDGTLSLAEQESQLRTLTRQAEFYGSQELPGLRSALADVTRQLQDMSDAAKDAFGQISDEYDRLQGNLVAIEKRRAQQQRDDLTERRDAAAAAGNADAVAQLNAALSKLGEVESLRLQEAKARMQAEKDRAEDGRKRRAQESSGGGMTPSGGPTTVNVQLPPAGPTGYNRADLEAFARQLNPVLSDLSRRGAL